MSWEWSFFLVTLGVALATIVVLRWRFRLAMAVLALGFATTAGAALWSEARSEQSRQEEIFRANLPREGGPEGYVSSDACRACHPSQYESWHRTYHRTMTQVATPESVKAPFEGVLRYQGQSYELSTRGGEYWVNMPDIESAEPGGAAPRVNRRVGLITGSHHMQAFWISDGLGNLQLSFPFTYLLEDERWVPRSDVFLARFEQDPQIWNYNCILCHTTRPQPRPQGSLENADSRVGEIGIGCESCHGPGEAHIQANSNPLQRLPRRWNGEADSTIVNPATLSPVRSSEICGQCHGLWSPVQSDEVFAEQGPAFRPGEEMEDNLRLLRPRQIATQPYLQELLKVFPDYARQRYWSDGIVRVSGRDYSGLIESACFQSGTLSCLSCHSMHESDPNDQLKRETEGNEACLQCHDSFRDRIVQHTGHAENSPGSTCYNCHMPRTVYGLLKSIRSHYIDSPDAEQSSSVGRPNACNLCHLDKSHEWTANYLSEWYGYPTAELPAEDTSTAASLLQLLRGDAGQRALIASHMGWTPAQEASGTDWFVPFLAELLDDDYSAVRYIAGQSLQRVPGYETFEYDYLSAGLVRDEAKTLALDLWRASQSGPERIVGRELLIEPSGDLMEDEIRRLIGERDPRPLFLAE